MCSYLCFVRYALTVLLVSSCFFTASSHFSENFYNHPEIWDNLDLKECRSRPYTPEYANARAFDAVYIGNEYDHDKPNFYCITIKDSVLYKDLMRKVYPVCPCPSILESDESSAYTLPDRYKRGEIPFALLGNRMVFANTDGTLSYCCIDSDGDSLRWHKTVSFEDTLKNKTILRLIPDPDAYMGTIFWVLGKEGTVRRIARHYQDYEKNFDIDTKDDILYYRDGHVSTSSGAIYKITENSPAEKVTQISNKAIWCFNDSAAVGDDGFFFIKKGDTWEEHKLDTLDYRYFRTDWRPKGLGILLIDKHWNARFHIYQNEPAKIDSVYPDTLKNHINGSPYYFNAIDSMSITITTTDPENNDTIPALFVCTNTEKRMLRLTNFYPKNSGGAGKEHVDCHNLGTYMLNLFRDSISIDFPCNLLKEKFYCMVWWEPDTFERSMEWGNGDTLFFIVVADTIKIVNNVSGSTQALISRNQNTIRYTIENRGNSLLINNPNRKFSFLDIYSPDGRRITTVPISSSEKKVLTNTFAPGLLIMVYRNQDKSKKVPFLNIPR